MTFRRKVDNSFCANCGRLIELIADIGIEPYWVHIALDSRPKGKGYCNATPTDGVLVAWDTDEKL